MHNTLQGLMRMYGVATHPQHVGADTAACACNAELQNYTHLLRQILRHIWRSSAADPMPLPSCGGAKVVAAPMASRPLLQSAETQSASLMRDAQKHAPHSDAHVRFKCHSILAGPAKSNAFSTHNEDTSMHTSARVRHIN